MVRSRRAAMAMVAAGALTLAACGASDGSDGGATTSTAPAGATSTSSTTAATRTSTTLVAGASSTTTVASGPSGSGATSTTLSDEGRDTETSQLDTLSPDGAHYGYVAGVENGTVEGQAVQVIIWDEVQFLTGDAADAAALAAGDESPVPNDYYIVNDNQTVRRLAVVPEAQVTTLNGGSPDPVPSSVSEVADAGEDLLYKIEVGTVRGITTVSGIEGVYLP